MFNSLLVLSFIAVFLNAGQGSLIDPERFDSCSKNFCLGILDKQTFFGTNGCLGEKNCDLLLVVGQEKDITNVVRIRWTILVSSKDMEGALVRLFLLKDKEELDDTPDWVPFTDFQDTNYIGANCESRIKANKTELHDFPFQTLTNLNYKFTNTLNHPSCDFAPGSQGSGKILSGSMVTDRSKTTITKEDTGETVYEIDYFDGQVYPYIVYQKRYYKLDTPGNYTMVREESEAFVTTRDPVKFSDRNSYPNAKVSGKKSKNGKQSIGWLVVLCIILGLLIIFLCISCVINKPKGSGQTYLAEKNSTTDGLTSGKDSKSKVELSKGNDSKV